MEPDSLILPRFDLRHQVILPGDSATVHACRPRTKAMLAAIGADVLPGQEFVACLQRDPIVEDPEAGDLYPIACRVVVRSAEQFGDVGWSLEVEGLERARLIELETRDGRPVARVQKVPVRATADLTRSSSLSPVDRAEAPLLAFDELVGVLQIEDESELGAALGALSDRLAGARAERAAVPKPPVFEDLKQLWPLEDSGLDEIERRLELGAIDADEAEQLRHLREHGWILWEGLIDPDLVDRFVADLAAIKDRPGEFLLTDHRRHRPYRLSGPDFDHFENIYDSYVLLESSRQVCYHPKIKRFLELVFDAEPIATQQLLFQRSNQHMLHQDTAFVCVDESLQLLATWIALEDVVEGRGELTYYDRSHLIEPFRFADGSRRFAGGGHEAEAVGEELRRRCEAAGCEKRDFLAKKGDVFFWAADLVHGSNPRTADPELTRRSCVTHYCPDWTRPTFMRALPDHRGVERFPEGAVSSTYYRLPSGGEVVRPVPQMPEPC